MIKRPRCVAAELCWQCQVLEQLVPAVRGHDIWSMNIASATRGNATKTIHLAVFIEPYLRYMLDGRKTVESRFSVNACAPYQRVSKGDLLLLKRSGGPIVGVCEVGAVWSYRLEPDTWKTIRKEFAAALCAHDSGFWEARKSASFATLMTVKRMLRIEPPILCEKRDRRGWVVLRTCEKTSLFWEQ